MEENFCAEYPLDLSNQRCPCGTGLRFEQCCGKYHAGALAPTALTLMRSRFSAFVSKNAEYLLRTWDPATRPYDLEMAQMPFRFYRLDIIEVIDGGPLDTQGIVEFEAFYKGEFSGSQRERSTFLRIDGSWYYSAEV